MRYKHILVIVILAITSSCSKVETQTIITDIYPTQEQFTKEYLHGLDVELTSESLPADLNKIFNVKGTAIYGDELFCANYSARRIDIFDANTFKYKESIIDAGANILSRDVYADDKYIYITGISAPRCQVSIYDRLTKKYICRLGNGSWAGPVVHAICVASSGKYVFVRDQGNKVKVFLKSEIGQGKSIGVHSYLNIDGQSVMNTDEYDMCVVDSVLYAVNIKNKAIYTYHVNTDCKKNTETAYNSKLIYSDAQSPRAIASSDKYLFIATNASSAIIHAYIRGKGEINLDKPKFSLSSITGNAFTRIEYIAAKGDTLFINQNDKKVTLAQIKINIYDQTEDLNDENIN